MFFFFKKKTHVLGRGVCVFFGYLPSGDWVVNAKEKKKKGNPGILGRWGGAGGGACVGRLEGFFGAGWVEILDLIGEEKEKRELTSFSHEARKKTGVKRTGQKSRPFSAPFSSPLRDI